MARLLMEIYEEEVNFAPTDERVDGFADFSYGKLGCILAATIGISNIAQTAHWSAKGRDFYEDHLLFERIYNAFNGFVDPVAEKAVGMSKDGRIVDTCRLMKATYAFVEETNHLGQEELSTKVLIAVQSYKKLVTKCYIDMKADGLLTPGIENLLQGLLDETEKQEYLLGRIQSGILG